MHKKSLEAQDTYRDDSGVSDHEDSAGSKSNDETRILSSSNESLNVVSPVPSVQQHTRSPITPPTTTTTSSSPNIDFNSPPPTPQTPYAATSPSTTQTLSQMSVPLHADNSNTNFSNKDFHLIMNTAVAAAAAAAAATHGDSVSQHLLGRNDAYSSLDRDPEVFRNNSIACLRAKAQEHQARFLKNGLLLQVHSISELQNNIALNSHPTTISANNLNKDVNNEEILNIESLNNNNYKLQNMRTNIAIKAEQPMALDNDTIL